MNLVPIARHVARTESVSPDVSTPSRVMTDKTMRAVLASPQSQRVLAIVHQSPGISLSDLRRATGSGWGALYHHVSRLSRAGLLQTRVIGGRRLAFATVPGAPSSQSPEARSLLCGRTARKIAEAVAKQPYESIAQLCDDVGASPRVVYYHIKRLAQAGLVRSAAPNRRSGLLPTPLLLDILATTPSAPG